MNRIQLTFSALLLTLVLTAGCRREDIRTVTVEIPSLNATNQAQIVDAFLIRTPGMPQKVYDGIDGTSLKFDFDRKTLTLKYDSMKIAQTNIRMLIQDHGIKVVFPENTTGRAGY